MKKAVISNRIYLNADPELKSSLEKELTYEFQSFDLDSPPIRMYNLTHISDHIVSIPVGRMDLIPEGYEIVDKRLLVPVEFPEFKYKLRDSQQKVYDDIDSSCIINAWVSWGKTFAAIAIATKLGQKTLVMVDTKNLLTQWSNEVYKTLGIRPSIIGDGKFDTSGPITIGIGKSLVNNLNKINKTYGTLIVDEMHHSSSSTFRSVIDSSHAMYKIGLSGTITRKDGRHVIFKDFFGPKVIVPEKENYMPPKILVINSGLKFPGDFRMHWAKRVNALKSQQEYQKLVCDLAATMEHNGHKVLIVSDRVDFLNVCGNALGDKAVVVTGKTKNREELLGKIKEGSARILCGTQKIFAEGFSEESLSCLILATPINNDELLTQLVGRIIRKMPGKKQPVVIDIKLLGNTGTRQYNNRLGFYMSQGWDIEQKYLS